jgi:SAM-dependent methyltransferase
MKTIAEMRGLRFPDVYVTRIFFKEGLQRQAGRVLELGCGSGNNLSLFSAFGWDVTGMDISGAALADARHNLEGGTFIECDLSSQFPLPEPARFDAVLLPNVIYYLPRSGFVRVLRECRRRAVPGGLFLLIARLPQDWRWGRGAQEEPGGFRLECRETGEYGLLNVFYDEDELLNLIDEHFGVLERRHKLRSMYENLQNGIVVRNEEVVVWGRVPAT